MPPFIPHKRLASTPPQRSSATPAKRPRLADALDADSANIPSLQKSKHFTLGENDSESSLSDVDSDEFEDVPTTSKKASEEEKHDDDDDEDIEWEDAAPQNASEMPTHTPVIGDIQLTFRKDEDGGVDYGTSAAASKGKKGPSKREKQVRIQTHCMHVQFLLYHNSIRNRWICDKTVQDTLVKQLPSQIKREVERWRTASGLDTEQNKDQEATSSAKSKRKGKQKTKNDRNERDWGKPSQRLEQGKPDLSHGDPLVHLMKVLSAYWKKRFAITAPGLRKRGYGTKLGLKQEIASYRNDEHDPEKHGERISNLKEFREIARKCEGSRDVGAQLFTALLRGLGVESRLVASLQPSGYGWTKAEQMLPRRLGKKTITELSSESSEDEEDEMPQVSKSKAKGKENSNKPPSSKASRQRGNKSMPIDLDSDAMEGDEISDGESVVDITSSMPKQKPAKYDRDLAFPIYWTEAISPIDHTVLPVSPLVLASPVASTTEVLSTFEPRGAKAEKGKQVMAYVVAYSADGTAKEVTVRYLRKKLWPGKTKGSRLPIEKVPIYNKNGKIKRYEEYDWFKHTMSGYVRTDAMRTPVDDVEDTSDLVPAEPEKKDTKEEGDTLQSLRSSADFVLERFLRREEALRPNAMPDRTFVSGKGDSVRTENVYRRSDVERCLTVESWHKEGRIPKTGENPMKLVPVRAVTLTRKREAEDHQRQTGEKQMQGIYSWDQTEYIIPPPIVNGVIPKNSYGNMDCFVPSMVPKGAVHVPLRGTVRICKKLDIDFAEAVTGFEFGNKRAVPVCTGVVVAKENEKILSEAWEKYNEEQRIKEEGKLEKLCLDMWRKLLMGMRIRERVNEDYGDDPMEDEEPENSGTIDKPITLDGEEGGGFVKEGDDEDMDGGFLLPHEDESAGGDLVMENHEPEPKKVRERKSKDNAASQYPTPSSMQLPKSAKRNAKQSLLRAGSESSELSEVSSSIASDHDDDNDEYDRQSAIEEGRKGARVHVEVPRRPHNRSSLRQIDGSESADDGTEQIKTGCSDASSGTSVSGTQDQESDGSIDSDESGEEDYTPKKTVKSKARKSSRPNQVKIGTPAQRKSTRAATGTATSKTTPKTQAATPRRRGLRRDSTVITSPYFGAE